jgi:4a-hydroxytetrahydrobiopterin dehydratase
MQKLVEQELNAALKQLPGWNLVDGSLVREWRFNNFKEAMNFVNEVAEAAETANHHPDIDIRYNRVRLALVTHDVGGITANDISFASAANLL